jgi:multidrug efflux pump
MNGIIDAAFAHGRAILLILVFVLVAGGFAYLSIPKESEPDVAIPIIYVSMTHDGISPDDAERLLVKPMEKELRAIAGIKEMKGTAGEGHASVLLEFDAGFDAKQALQDVREKVDIAKAQLPDDTEEPTVHEINVALFPVLTVSLAGPIPERSLLHIARDLKDRIEALPNVLEVDIGGERDEVLEIVVDPVVMETYRIEYTQLFNLISRNNLLVAAGAVDSGAGRYVLKVPGIIERMDDLLRMPIKAVGDTVITVADVATVRKTFKDPEGFVRVDGQPAITLEISKRVGANIIDTIESVRVIVEKEREHWPASVQVSFLQDKSNDIRDMLADLQNNVVSAIVLVMIIIIGALGLRSSVLVGLAIPGSFLAGILIIYSLDYTLNIVVLFSLILVVGMLVDGAIVVTELADRKTHEGLPANRAFAAAAKRMAGPIVASTATTLAVFLPLIFWPGVVGQFMKYLPITVAICLLASLAMALVFVPVLGGALGGRRKVEATLDGGGDGISSGPGGGGYLWLLGKLLRYPGLTLLAAILVLVGAYAAYGLFGHGVEFFPDVEPEFAQVQVRARGDLSIYEKDAVLRDIEARLLDMEELRAVYARSFNTGAGNNRAEDVIGVIQLELTHWRQRRKATAILDEIRRRTEAIPGVVLEVRKQENGPSEGKPIQLQLSARNPDKLPPATLRVRQLMDAVGGFVDVEDNRPLPGIEWQLRVDREQAARYGADVALLGNAVQMITHGVKVAEYRPDDSEDEVDIRIRFPFDERNLGQLDQLTVPTANGMVPIVNFVELVPAPKTGTLQRVGGQRVITVQADVREGLLVDAKLRELRQALAGMDRDPGVDIIFKGEDEDQREAIGFLTRAFLIAIFVMFVILVTQFNSLYQSVLVMSAIVFSTAGVLLGLLVTGRPFGIVMVGIGIIALAGIVVNNNIVLIDTYNTLRREGLGSMDAALRTGALRMRPVLLTAVTTVLGLMPMVLALNIDLIHRDIAVGAPSTQWWTQLSSAIAGGLTFATVLTLILTPCLLVLGDRLGGRRKVYDQSTAAVSGAVSDGGAEEL